MSQVENPHGAVSEISITGLKNRKDFVAARKGARSFGRAFVLQGLRRPALDSSFENPNAPVAGSDEQSIRVGYTVTKKVGNSVERNRIRRRMREALRLIGPLSALAGHDVVIIAKREALAMPFEMLVDSLSQGLKQLVAKRGPNGQKRKSKVKT